MKSVLFTKYRRSKNPGKNTLWQQPFSVSIDFPRINYANEERRGILVPRAMTSIHSVSEDMGQWTIETTNCFSNAGQACFSPGVYTKMDEETKQAMLT